MADPYDLPVDNNDTITGIRELAHDLAQPTHTRLRALRMLCNAYGLLDKWTRPRTVVIVRYTPRLWLPPDDDDEREFDDRHAANIRVVNDLKQIAGNRQESAWHRLTAWGLLGKIGDLFEKVRGALRVRVIYRNPTPPEPRQQAEPNPDSEPSNDEFPNSGSLDNERPDI